MTTSFSEGIPDHPQVVFPDWSPYTDLEEAVHAYLRDPAIAMTSLTEVLGDRPVLGFTLERYVDDVGAVWQEVAVCDGERVILWHGEDTPSDGTGDTIAMTSSLRVVALSAVTEVGFRRRLTRFADGNVRAEGIDVYMLLTSLIEATVPPGNEGTAPIRHDALRFAKNVEDGGPGPMARLEEFGQLVASLTGRPAVGSPTSTALEG